MAVKDSLRGRSAGKDPGAELVQRVRMLGEAADLCDGRVDVDVVAEARRVIAQTDRRLAISGGATVVALAGATGSGKSSTFNALSGTTQATVGVRRPTTSQALACTWGADSAEELLDWLKVPRRHAIERDPSMAAALDGLVLLDLPDHDSTEVAHHVEVDRLVRLVDMLVWVVDPQKYADAALHDRYLKPLAQHAEVMMVVLNQVDLLSDAERDACLKDLRRLLDAEGLGRVQVQPVSAATGEGVDALRSTLARQVADKKAAARRLSADVAEVASRLSVASGSATAAPVPKQTVSTLNAALGDAAGVPLVTDAVAKAWRLRGGLATGWPVLSWLAKFKPDPLRRLRLGSTRSARGEIEADPVGRTSLPTSTGVPRARVDSALRGLADASTTGLTRGWSDAVKAAARANADGLPDALDRAVATTDLDLQRHRGWWQAVRVTQWILVAAIVAGLLWLGSAFVLVYLQLPPLPKISWWGIPAPTVLTVGSVLTGLLLAALSRIGVEIGARRRSVRARHALRTSIGRVTRDQVLTGVNAELERYEAARTTLDRVV